MSATPEVVARLAGAMAEITEQAAGEQEPQDKRYAREQFEGIRDRMIQVVRELRGVDMDLGYLINVSDNAAVAHAVGREDCRVELRTALTAVCDILVTNQWMLARLNEWVPEGAE